MKQKTKTKIGLIYGGPSSEHEVSVRSAEQVKKYLDKNKYLILPIKISKQGEWPKNLHPYNLKNKIDIAFIVMHGEWYIKKDETIRKWMERDEARDKLFETATAPEDITCPTC
jgi:D-alanine-D-alanine ligase-like ATP-grasp enzyme